jgi:alkylhydroperoxidase family enzyme
MSNDRPATPRIPPLAPDERTDEQQQMLAPPMPQFNIFATLARNPRLFRHWMPFANKVLLGSCLHPVERELVILRVAWRCQARYEWGQHVLIAREAGCSNEEIARIVHGPTAAGWSPTEVLLLQAVDELVDDHCISDTTWDGLRAHYDEQQLIEIPMLAGQYILLAGVLNSLGVQPETDDFPALGGL